MVRHCNAEGQHKDSPLTKDGIEQSQLLSTFLENNNNLIDRIISSPYLRAIESIRPYALTHNIPIEIDYRLQERLLSQEPIDDWMDVLEESFTNFDFCLPGGESSNDALDRAYKVIEEVLNDKASENVVIVTHGNLLALLLHRFQGDIGFNHWKELTNPDIFLVQGKEQEYSVERIWA
ncbi:histidine phosphatase family protein [Aquibacillus koreensis]|uniref:Histidine phosphatase family protein n=2 Tax=Aquibacillus koreensis TaxID=279446 RepID=A0A9X3WT04_9BACI|nr:histidine phosphatase family protein [Aquibacillus koreensis]MCT2536085.1 histidine phosphatase family protein [Aquibacillus koreensis]MDC3422809.1 histidine phosphatase family protein [Aquibacillus koreensis]